MADQSIEMTMVERVARALADQSPRCRGWWSDMSELEKMAWRNSARAAIEAMRLPNEGMRGRGAEASFDLADEVRPSVAGGIFIAMIDAALQEKPPTT